MNPFTLTLHSLAQAALDAQAMVPTWSYLGGLLALLAVWAMVTDPEAAYGCPCLDCTPDRIPAWRCDRISSNSCRCRPGEGNP